jgi:hypothetical protein
VIFVAIGGSGSEYLCRALRLHYRPDRAFGIDKGDNWQEITIYDFPTQKEKEKFAETANGYHIDLGKNIIDNMIDYIDFVERNNIDILLQGFLSRVSGDSLCEKLNYNHICLVRHPLHTYVSLLCHRHPNMALKFENGIEDIGCIQYFADMWNSVVKDHSYFIRYEYAYEDSMNLQLSDRYLKVINGLYSSKRNNGVLSIDGENVLKELVKDNFERLYDKWEI